MAKITIETDDIAEARSLLDALETRAVPSAPTPAVVAVSSAPTPAVVEEVQTEARSVPEPAAGDEEGGELDVHGMVWDEKIHAGTKAKNADGSWKVRKGSAEAAKAAIAAHKAAGGNVTPPADLPATGMPTPAAPVGLPNAAAAVADMPAPVTQAKLEEKIIGMLTRGTLSNDAYTDLLMRNGVDLDNPSGALATNETLRAAVYNDCLSVEPEA